MSLFWVAVTVTVVSVGYSLHMAQKARKAAERARREAEQKAELQKGFQFTEEGEAKPIPIMYGRAKIGGVRVHFKVTDNYTFANAAGGGVVFESMKQPANATPIVYRLVNSNANWTGSWSYVPSSVAEFASSPGWVVTKDEINVWKFPNRAFEGDTLIYTAPAVDFVFCSFKNGTDTSTKPSAALQALGFQFPVRTNTEPVLDKNLSGEKNEFYFIQQAICQSGISNIYTVDVDQKPYTYDAYSYGLRIHAYKNGSVADPLMIANDSSRTNARFTNVAYATCAFKLNRDDPQYNGTPEVQFYAEGNSVKEIVKNGNNYSLSNFKVYSNNSALVLLDYLTNSFYGKGVAESDIDLESFYKAAKICAIRVKSNVTNKGKLNLSKGGTKHIYLYECNLILDSAAASRDNIQKILDTMAMSSLVWTEGKYRLNLPYSYVFTAGNSYQIDDVVQVTDSNSKNRLFRAINPTVQNPLVNSSDWVEDVIPSDVININDNDLVRDTEVLISWPDASTKLNFATVRFLNEEKDFSEDTINWPEKEPTDGSAIYQTFLNEDNGIQLETESFEDGCITPYHALARAEQRVRASRDIIVYNFKAVARVFTLEPGDLFGFSSDLFKIPYTILKVDEIETEEGGVVKVTGSTFDARLLAWNVPDNFYAPLPDNFEGYSLKQAKNLRMVLGESNNRTSNYRLEWDSAGDNRVSRYIVKYTSDSINNITSTTVWTEIITTSSLSCELPALDGNYTFTVVSMAANGRQALFRNFIEGSTWPLINYTMSSAFLEGFDSLNVVLSNDVHSLLSNADGLVAAQNYAGSGTSVKVYSGSTALIYDGVGTTPGTWKVTAPAGNQVGITAGTIAVDPADSTTAIVGNHSNMIAGSAYIDYVISGTTISGATFLLNKKQTFTKVFPAASVTVSASSQIFSIAQNGTATPSAITFSATLQNTAQVITWDCIGGTLTDGTNGVKILQYTDMTQEQAVVTATAGSYADRITVTKLREGIDSYAAFLTNETHTLQADSSGAVSSFASATTSMTIYKGTQLDTSNWTFHVSGVSTGTKYRDNDDNVDRDGTGTTNGAISAFPIKIVSLTQDEGYLDITATRTGQSITKRFTVAKARSGYDAKIYSILLSAPVIFKNSPTAAIDGVHTNITATGQLTVGNTASTFGYLTATYNGVQEAAAATANAVTTDIANNADITSVTFKLYSTENKTQLLDSVTVPVIFRGATGASALNIVLTNQTHAIPCNESGVVQSYEGSGTDVLVYEGGTALSYDPNYDGSVNGTWKVTVSTTNIVKSTTQTDEGSFVRFGDHSNLSQNTASITYTATGKTSEGVAFSISATQTFSKINYGVDARVYYIGVSAPAIFKNSPSFTVDGVHSNITATGYRVTGSTTQVFGYLTATLSGANEVQSATANSVTTDIANDSDITNVTFRLYNSSDKNTLLDTLTVPVVLKGITGSSALNIILSNATHAIPCNEAGTVLTYDSSGTDVYLYEGGVSLKYNPNYDGSVNGEFKVTTSATGITVGTSSDEGDFVRYAKHSAITVNTAKITYTATGKTSEGVAFTVAAEQTLSKVNYGVDARYIYIFTSSPVIFKDAASASLDGVHSNVTVKGRRVIGDTVADFGFVTYQTDKMANESARAASHTTEIANDADITSITVRLYETSQSTAILDTEFIPVVFKGLKGSGAVNGVLSNGTHAIPCSSDGTVLTDGYNNSGTSLYVYEGASRLVYDGTGTSNGTWKVDAAGTGITVSTSVTDSGDFVTYGNHSALTAESAVITYTVTGKTSEGISFTFTVDQTFVKARRGETIIEGYLNNTDYVFVTDESGTISSYTGTGVDISVYEGNTKLSYDGTGTANGTWKSTAAATNITASTSLTDLGTDVRYGVADAMTADLAYIDFTLTGKSTTGKAFTLVKRQNFTKRKQGVTGKKTARVQLYQWSTATPATPTGNSTFTWSSLSNGTYTKSPNTAENVDNWKSAVPSNPGTPGIRLWTATKTVEAANSASTTSIAWTDATVEAISQNGQAGVHGATPTLYKWAATIPAAPSGSNTWTWASNDFNAVSTANTNAGWSKSPGTATAGYTLWAARVNISDSAANETTAFNWSSASVSAVSYAGGDGDDGVSYIACYAAIAVTSEVTASANIVKSGQAVPTATESNNSWGVNVTWSTTAPVLGANQRLWTSDGVYNPVTNQTTWSTPYWSSLKVGTLSAITANVGALTAGTLSNGTNTFVIDLTNGTITISV